MLIITLRTVIVYVVLTVFMRLLGKRQVGQMQVEELVTALLLSELAAFPIADPDIPLLHAAIPVALIVLLELISSCLCTVFPRLNRFIEGAPSILIANGILDQRQMYKCRISPDELLAELRLKDVGDPSAVEWAILEQSGRLSVILKKNEDGSPEKAPALSLPLIVGGTVHRTNLDRFGISMKALKQSLGKKKIRDVLLCTSDGVESKTLIFRDKRL